jgi:hypothetical protein
MVGTIAGRCLGKVVGVTLPAQKAGCAVCRGNGTGAKVRDWLHVVVVRVEGCALDEG